MASTLRSVQEIAVLYPCDSLARQILAWARRHTDCAVRPVFARSLPAIRAAIRGARAVLVDATEDHVQAIDAFSEAMTQRGAAAATVYTERVHEGLELFVRAHGALLLLGPLSDAQWEEFLQRPLRSSAGNRSRGRAA
jgi:hypothetical protein